MDISYYYDQVCCKRWCSQVHCIKEKLSNNSKTFSLQSKTRARIYPAYHTAYDTFDYASTYIDPGELNTEALKWDNKLLVL